MKKYAIFALLIISLMFNGLLGYYVYENKKPDDKIIKFGFEEPGVEIYCEKASDAGDLRVNMAYGEYNIGTSTLIYDNKSLYFVSEDGITELTDDAYVINSNGEILYQLTTPQEFENEMVFATPSGKKYHRDASCAGRNAFEIPLESAKYFRTPCSFCY